MRQYNKRLIGIENNARMLMTSPIDVFPCTIVMVIRSEETIRNQLRTLAFVKSWSTIDTEYLPTFTPLVLVGAQLITLEDGFMF